MRVKCHARNSILGGAGKVIMPSNSRHNPATSFKIAHNARMDGGTANERVSTICRTSYNQRPVYNFLRADSSRIQELDTSAVCGTPEGEGAAVERLAFVAINAATIFGIPKNIRTVEVLDRLTRSYDLSSGGAKVKESPKYTQPGCTKCCQK